MMAQDFSQTQMSLANCWASARGILCVESMLTSRNTLIKELRLKVPFAKPYFSESDKDTFNISSNDAEKRITKNTLAMVPVHLAGNPCDMKELSELAEDNHILMIEDCAHAHDAKYQGKNCGSLGVASAFSFYSTKVMTSGEGGMVTTDDKDIADRVR